MDNSTQTNYMKGFLPYALAAFLVGIIGGLSTMLGPAFMQDMNLPYNNTTWTALAQAISSAACAPILGKLGDVFGRHKTLLLGILIFTLGNVLSAIAASLFFMLVARFVVGIGIAAIAPTVMSHIVAEFPPQQIAKGFSLYMLISSASVIFGPTLGSLVLESLDWRALMWISAVICGITFILCFFTHQKQAFSPTPLTDFDKTGAFFVIVFFSLLLCVPSFGQNFGWISAEFLPILSLTVLAFLGLVIAEKRAKNPILVIETLLRHLVLPFLSQCTPIKLHSRRLFHR